MVRLCHMLSAHVSHSAGSLHGQLSPIARDSLLMCGNQLPLQPTVTEDARSGDVLTERGWSWVGVDISEDMLGLAKSKHRGGIACSDLSQGLPVSFTMITVFASSRHRLHSVGFVDADCVARTNQRPAAIEPCHL